MIFVVPLACRQADKVMRGAGAKLLGPGKPFRGFLILREREIAIADDPAIKVHIGVANIDLVGPPREIDVGFKIAGKNLRRSQTEERQIIIGVEL